MSTSSQSRGENHQHQQQQRHHENYQFNLSAAVASAANDASKSPLPLLTVPASTSPSDILRNALRTYATVTMHTPPPPTVVAIDLSTLAANVALFRAEFPRVLPHYAVKCLPDPAVLSVLAALGLGFDVASPAEIDLAMQALRSSPRPSLTSTLLPPADSRSRYDSHHQNLCDSIVYANPIKAPQHIRYANSVGVRLVTVDCVSELVKLKQHLPHARVLLRLATDDATSAIPLSDKFGALERDVDSLLIAARRLSVALVGVAFHAGSGAASPEPYVSAIRAARRVFTRAAHFGHGHLSVLDIGGGFPPTSERRQLTAIAHAVNRELEAFPRDVTVIAEPGRLLVASIASIATRVLRAAHSDVSVPDSRSTYAIGDGVYGVFRDALLTKENFVPRVLLRKRRNNDSTLGKSHSGLQVLNTAEVDGNGDVESGDDDIDDDEDYEKISDNDDDNCNDDNAEQCDLYGPTEEQCDLVASASRLPRLHPGDWIWFQHVGGYTLSLRSRRSDIEPPTIFYVFHAPGGTPVQEKNIELGRLRGATNASDGQLSALSE